MSPGILSLYSTGYFQTLETYVSAGGKYRSDHESVSYLAV